MCVHVPNVIFYYSRILLEHVCRRCFENKIEAYGFGRGKTERWRWKGSNQCIERKGTHDSRFFTLKVGENLPQVAEPVFSNILLRFSNPFRGSLAQRTRKTGNRGQTPFHLRSIHFLTDINAQRVLSNLIVFPYFPSKKTG